MVKENKHAVVLRKNPLKLHTVMHNQTWIRECLGVGAYRSTVTHTTMAENRLKKSLSQFTYESKMEIGLHRRV